MLLSPPRRVDDRSRRALAAWSTLSLLAFLACLAGSLPEAPPAPLSITPPPMPWAQATVWLPPAPAGGGHEAPAPRRSTPRPASPEAAPAPVSAVAPAALPAEGPSIEDFDVATGSESSLGVDEGGGGSGTGEGDGLGTGPGVGTGTGTGTGSGAPLSVHYTEAVPLRRAVPEWPQAALALGIHEARCVAHVVMDERGEPVSVDVRGCPPVFWSATRDAALGWRWEPFESGGEALRVQFDIAFEYQR